MDFTCVKSEVSLAVLQLAKPPDRTKGTPATANMKLLVFLLLFSLTVDSCWSQCRMANWWGSFDRKGWSVCGSSNEYTTGFYRNSNRGSNDQIFLLEEAKCCKAIAPNQNKQSSCSNANWWKTLDSSNQWALCPAGHFLQGLYRTSGHWLYNIEEGKCCKPAGLPNTYGKCVTKDIAASFDNKGLSSCDDGYYMAGFYKGSCNQLYCIEKIKCCKMHESPPTPSQECSNYQEIDDSTRSRGYQSNNYRCDNYMATKWYRFSGASGNRMPTSCVPTHRCGTHAPGWIDGNHPTVNQGIVSVKVCFHWSNNCCRWSTNIRVRNCDGFFVYELKKPPACHLGYCGNAGPGPSPPLECSNYQYLDDEKRARSYEGNSYVCDNNLPTKWYRFRGASGNQMPSSCVTTHRCGTHAPGWLQGNHPTVAQGIVSAKVCFHWSNNCCRWSTNIRVRNCDGFFVYELKKPPACRLRYCGNSDRNQCKNIPCKNGATCINLQGSYRCECKPEFYGKNCEKDTNECANNPCKNGATCVNLQGSYRCDCKSGYSGNKCETDVNECAKNPCKNGATCVNLQGSYRCKCKSGYTGSNCQTDVNECANSPCKNGATCVNLQGSYRCDCKSGYIGNKCETDINECTNNPCKNGATCANLQGSYRCDCKSGYMGNNCQTDVNECTNNPCKNGATCANLQGSYRCDCKSGYSGNNCETDINECTNNPCKNGASCVNLQGSYHCDCKSGYSGNNCDTDINECANNPCKNGAACVNLQGSYRCDCTTGYTGKNCETDINECMNNPCKNGATCVNLQGSYRCDCKSGYSGKNCETDVNDCALAPCQNVGKCVDLVGGYRCDCISGFSGITCETAPTTTAPPLTTNKPVIPGGEDNECQDL